MLQPAYRNYRKAFKGRIPKGLHHGNLTFGTSGLRAVEGGRLTARQLEAARRALRRNLTRDIKIWSLKFPDIPVSGKPSEVRMGKGKGSNSYWATRIRPGHMIFEVSGFNNQSTQLAYKGLESARKKLPMRCRIVERMKIVV